MSNTSDPTTPAGFVAKSRKAFVAAGAAAIAAAGAQVPGILADGKVETGELLAAAGVVIGAAAVAFAAVWTVPNAQD